MDTGAQVIVREKGMCGVLSSDRTRVCILPPGHAEPHPWETPPPHSLLKYAVEFVISNFTISAASYFERKWGREDAYVKEHPTDVPGDPENDGAPGIDGWLVISMDSALHLTKDGHWINAPDFGDGENEPDMTEFHMAARFATVEEAFAALRAFLG